MLVTKKKHKEDYDKLVQAVQKAIDALNKKYELLESQINDLIKKQPKPVKKKGGKK